MSNGLVIILLTAFDTSIAYLSGLGTLVMIGSTMLDASSPGGPLAPGPLDPSDAVTGSRWVEDPNVTALCCRFRSGIESSSGKEDVNNHVYRKYGH
jgi:hypothetical protein